MKPGELKQLLIDARAVIEDEANWTQGDTSRNAEGNYVTVDSAFAVSFCAYGAVCKAGGYSSFEFDVPAHIQEAHDALVRAAGISDRGVGNFNDTHTHEEVLAVFDKAIEEA